MLTSSYKYHLHLHHQKTKSGFGKKALYTIIAMTILFTGTISALLLWQYQKEAPIRAQNHYLEVASGGFGAAKQSINETMETFQVAGVKVVTVDSLKEASSTAISSGFVVLLEDIDKTIAKIESAQKVIKNQKLDLKKQNVPDQFRAINNNLINFYDLAIDTLESSKQENFFAKEMLIAMGNNLYLPTLSDETLWRLKNEEQIKNYYQSKKSEIDWALASLARLSIPESFKPYYDAQIAYLIRLADLSDQIIRLLSEENDKNPDNALQIEKAYQILTAAKKENEQTSEKLLTERLYAFNLKRNLNIYAAVRLNQNSIEEKLEEAFKMQPQIKSLTPTLITNFANGARNILNSLQTPSII